jgi:outer membrane protein assembly factor BamB
VLLGAIAILLAAVFAFPPLVATTPNPHSGLVASASSRTPLTDTSNWTMYMAFLGRTGVQQQNRIITPASAPKLTLIWNYTTGGRVIEQPIVHGDTLYIGSWDGNEYAFNATTGAVVWKTFVGTTAGCTLPHPRGPSSTAEYLNGRLYFSGGDSYYYALNATNGSVLWRTFLMNNSPAVGFYGWSSGIVHNGSAYAGLASGCSLPNVVGGVAEIRLANHTIVQRLVTTPPGTLGADVWGTPAYDATTNTIFVSTGNDSLATNPYDDAQLALDPTTLAIRSNWSVPLAAQVNDSDFGTTPVMVTTPNGTLLDVAADKNGILYALNRTNLSRGPLWATRIANGATYSSAAFAQGEIFVGSTKTSIHGTTTRGAIRAIAPATGRILWAVPMPGGVFSSISYSNGLVAVTGGSEIALLNASTGASVWNRRIGATFEGSASFAHGMLFVGGDNGEVFAYGIPNSGTSHGVSSSGVSSIPPTSPVAGLAVRTRWMPLVSSGR